MSEQESIASYTKDYEVVVLGGTHQQKTAIRLAGAVAVFEEDLPQHLKVRALCRSDLFPILLFGDRRISDYLTQISDFRKALNPTVIFVGCSDTQSWREKMKERGCNLVCDEADLAGGILESVFILQLSDICSTRTQKKQLQELISLCKTHGEKWERINPDLTEALSERALALLKL